MRYITQEPDGAYDLTGYEDYLENERANLVRFVDGEGLLRIERNGLDDRGSFHDARLAQLSVTTDGTPRIELSLKGPYFDRHFLLVYEEVSAWKIAVPAPDDDLLVHEVRIEDGPLIHELHFDGGHAIEIRCGRLRFEERLLRSDGPGPGQERSR